MIKDQKITNHKISFRLYLLLLLFVEKGTQLAFKHFSNKKRKRPWVQV